MKPSVPRSGSYLRPALLDICRGHGQETRFSIEVLLESRDSNCAGMIVHEDGSGRWSASLHDYSSVPILDRVESKTCYTCELNSCVEARVIYQGKHMGGADAQIPPGEKGPMGVVDLDAGISDGLVKTNQIGIGSDHGAGHNFGGAEAGTGPESDIDTEEQMETVEAG
jgi:hypothetical protein